MKTKILFLIFLSLNLWGKELFKIEKKYFKYEKVTNFECNVRSKTVFYFKSTFSGRISTAEDYGMSYKCFHNRVYLISNSTFTATPTLVPCKCEKDTMWIKDEGTLKIDKKEER